MPCFEAFPPTLYVPRRWADQVALSPWKRRESRHLELEVTCVGNTEQPAPSCAPTCPALSSLQARKPMHTCSGHPRPAWQRRSCSEPRTTRNMPYLPQDGGRVGHGSGQGKVLFASNFSPGMGRDQFTPGEHGPRPSHGVHCNSFLLEETSGTHGQEVLVGYGLRGTWQAGKVWIQNLEEKQS